MTERFVATCSTCGQTWDIDSDPPACTCTDPTDEEWTLVVHRDVDG